jgi:hypothetical protein
MNFKHSPGVFYVGEDGEETSTQYLRRNSAVVSESQRYEPLGRLARWRSLSNLPAGHEPDAGERLRFSSFFFFVYSFPFSTFINELFCFIKKVLLF